MSNNQRHVQQKKPHTNAPEHDSKGNIIKELLNFQPPTCCIPYCEAPISTLIPLPKCQCNTKFIRGCIDIQKINQVNQSLSTKPSNNNIQEIINILHNVLFNTLTTSTTKKNKPIMMLQIIDKPFNLICKPCLNERIKTSNEVLEHDYLDERQRNPYFTVEPTCTSCRQKFTTRTLERQCVNHQDNTSNNSNTKNSNHSNNTNNNIDDDDLKDTINFIQHLENWKSILKNCQNNWDSNSCDIKEVQETIEKQIIFNWLDNLLTDNSTTSTSTSTRSVAAIQEITPGEVRDELMKKDAKFFQEVKDREYILSEEGQRELALIDEKQRLEQEQQDRDYAAKLQKDYDLEVPNNKSSTETFFQKLKKKEKSADSCNSKQRNIIPKPIKTKHETTDTIRKQSTKSQNFNPNIICIHQENDEIEKKDREYALELQRIFNSEANEMNRIHYFNELKRNGTSDSNKHQQHKGRKQIKTIHSDNQNDIRVFTSSVKNVNSLDNFRKNNQSTKHDNRRTSSPMVINLHQNDDNNRKFVDKNKSAKITLHRSNSSSSSSSSDIICLDSDSIEVVKPKCDDKTVNVHTEYVL